jgi:hypothetical protein
MGVDVDRAVKTKVARRADEIGEFLKGKNVAFTGTQVVGGGAQVEVTAANPGEVKDAVLGSTGYSEEMYAPGGAPDGAVRFAFKDSVLRDFREKAVKQAEKVIRNRVDKWGVTEPDIKTKANNQIQVQLPGFKDPEKAKELLGRTAQLEFKIADDENPVLDAVRAQLPQCQGDRQGLTLPLPESGCWTVETVELPNGGSRQATMVAANTRTELEKVIAEKLNPLLDPQKNVVGIGEGQVGQGPIKTTYYRTYLLRAKTELTGDYIAAADGRFYYNGGHMQVMANAMGLGALHDAALAGEIKSMLGTSLNLAYFQPHLAGGIYSSAGDYAQFLRNMLTGVYRYMAPLLGSSAVCTHANSADCPSALYSPINQSQPGLVNDVSDEAWHYSLGHWVEDDPQVGDGAFSSAGAFGFYPWIDSSKTYYGILARFDAANRRPTPAGKASVDCGRLISAAWISGLPR